MEEGNMFIFIFTKGIYGRSLTYYRVASHFTKYLIAKVIIPESLDSIGQFQHAEINKKDLTVSDVHTHGRTDGLTLIVEKLRF